MIIAVIIIIIILLIIIFIITISQTRPRPSPTPKQSSHLYMDKAHGVRVSSHAYTRASVLACVDLQVPALPPAAADDCVVVTGTPRLTDYKAGPGTRLRVCVRACLRRASACLCLCLHLFL